MTMPVINRATEETLAECPRASVEQLNRSVAAAKAAFPAWTATSIGDATGEVMGMAAFFAKPVLAT
jgi:acyl-CoA reductase-like NAD-dependent aldehyde dehydrogenase